MEKQHYYALVLHWTGNTGQGTSSYRSYERNYTISINGKPDVECSSDPSFSGDVTKYNPEDLLVASLAGCHMLWYLHLCAEAGVVVTSYQDHATGTMVETADGGGFFSGVTLSPQVTVASGSMVSTAVEMHEKANQLCFIANSVKFPVYHKPTILCRDKSQVGNMLKK
jgi:organic hydroperoxide reductase OsmC/OhrA